MPQFQSRSPQARSPHVRAAAVPVALPTALPLPLPLLLSLLSAAGLLLVLSGVR